MQYWKKKWDIIYFPMKSETHFLVHFYCHYFRRFIFAANLFRFHFYCLFLGSFFYSTSVIYIETFCYNSRFLFSFSIIFSSLSLLFSFKLKLTAAGVFTVRYHKCISVRILIISGSCLVFLSQTSLWIVNW